MDELRMGNIPSMSTDHIVKMLSNMYSKVINSKLDLKVVPSVMVWGPPGIGKSQSVEEIAKEIEYNTSKRVNVTDVRLILFNPVDLRGIPTSNEDRTLAVWLKPKIFQMDESDDVINILFLDEISAAPQSVQAAAYQITLDKTVGEHRLPDNCIVIAAGNRTTDKSVSYQVPKALSNRLLHIEMEASFDSWNNWAIGAGIHPYVLGFLKFKPDYLNNFDPKTTEYAFATPRSWEMVSNILNYVSTDFKMVFELIEGLIGKGAAVEFRTYCKVYSKLPDVEGIFRGTEKRIPKEPDILYALTSSMVAFASNHKDDMDMISNSIEYANAMTPDFSVVLLKDYMYIDKDYKRKLLRIPAYSRWLREKGRLLDAANGC